MMQRRFSRPNFRSRSWRCSSSLPRRPFSRGRKTPHLRKLQLRLSLRPRTALQLQNVPHAQQKTFSSPKEAAQALYDAARSHDEKALIAILGPGARDIVIWSDDQAERYAQHDTFAKNYEQMHRLVAEPDNETTLYVGAENWPVPFPLVEHNGSWFFDSDLGSREIMFRRIGENEMDAMEALRGIMAAENQFDAQNGEYAQHLNCSPGQHDGLFSPESGNDMDKNPIGPYLAEASYKRSDRTPFHGYYFLILTAQGAHAHGGARSYIVDGKMTGGFAVVAFPWPPSLPAPQA